MGRGDHLSLLSRRAGPGRCPRRRGCGWSWSSQPPLGSRPIPLPARTWVIVFIVSSPSAVGVDAPAVAGANAGRGAHLRAPGQPLSSMRAPTPARMPLVVHMLASGRVSRWGRWCRRVRRGSWSWCSWRLQPLGSIIQPAPAWTVVVVFMASSLDQVRVSRRGRSPSRRRRGGVSRCSSSAVRVDARAVASADRRSGVHGISFQPLGSMPAPTPARRVEVVHMTGSPDCGVDAERRRKCCLSNGLNA
jgi:hypothetical protein